MSDVILINVFASPEGGGSSTPVVLDASGYDEAGMLELTRRHGHESIFVFPPTDPGEADFRFRFFVPRQEDWVFDARQFPKASGFPEDVATGVAATALAFGLVAYGLIPCDGKRLTVRQGRAMGLPSEIFVRLDLPEGGSRPQGCFLGGRAVLTGGPR